MSPTAGTPDHGTTSPCPTADSDVAATLAGDELVVGRRRDERSERRAELVSLFVVLSVIAALVVAVLAMSSSALSLPGAPWRGARPTPSPPDAPQPLGTPTADADGTGELRFAATQDRSDTPVTFDPCRRIHVVVNDAEMPAAVDGLVSEAFDEVSQLIGLQFVFEGSTDEPPDLERPLFQPDRYGDRWAPVLVAWSNPESFEPFDGAAGLAGAGRVRAPDNSWVAVTGGVYLDASDFAMLARTGASWGEMKAIVLHEVGHLVGLSHVDDQNQLMHDGGPETTRFGDGDLAGLAQLGTGPCHPEL